MIGVTVPVKVLEGLLDTVTETPTVRLLRHALRSGWRIVAVHLLEVRDGVLADYLASQSLEYAPREVLTLLTKAFVAQEHAERFGAGVAGTAEWRGCLVKVYHEESGVHRLFIHATLCEHLYHFAIVGYVEPVCPAQPSYIV